MVIGCEANNFNKALQLVSVFLSGLCFSNFVIFSETYLKGGFIKLSLCPKVLKITSTEPFKSTSK